MKGYCDMPKYDYKCEKCGKTTVIDASVHVDKPKSIQCGCGARRLPVYTQGTETFAVNA